MKLGYAVGHPGRALPAAPGRDCGALRGRTHLHPTIEGAGPSPLGHDPAPVPSAAREAGFKTSQHALQGQKDNMLISPNHCLLAKTA